MCVCTPSPLLTAHSQSDSRQQRPARQQRGVAGPAQARARTQTRDVVVVVVGLWLWVVATGGWQLSEKNAIVGRLPSTLSGEVWQALSATLSAKAYFLTWDWRSK